MFDILFHISAQAQYSKLLLHTYSTAPEYYRHNRITDLILQKHQKHHIWLWRSWTDTITAHCAICNGYCWCTYVHQTAGSCGCDSLTLQCQAPSGEPSWCFPLWTKSCPCSRWQTSCLCLKGSCGYRAMICKYQMGTVDNCFGVEWFHTYLFEFDGNEYLVIANYYSNLPIVYKIQWGQCNAAKVISLQKQIFSEHRIPETLVSDNGPQYSSALFTEFANEWKFTHVTLSPHHPEGNGFARSMVKILQHAKYSGCDSHLTLFSYRGTLLNSKIASPAELLYQCWLQSTLQSCLRNTAPDADDTQEVLNNYANNSKAIHYRTAGPGEYPSM